MRGMRARVGYHVVYDPDPLDALEYAYEHGFDYIVPDLTIPRFWPEYIDDDERRELRRRSGDLDVQIALHAPLNLDLSTIYPEVRRGVLERLSRCLEMAVDLEAMWMTLHPSQPPTFPSAGGGVHLQGYLELHREALMETLSNAASQGVDIHIENDPLTPLIEDVLEELLREKANLHLTLDIPKAQDPAKGDPGRVLRFYLRNKERVRELHLHDKRPDGPAHDLLGLGGVDLKRYLRLFADVPNYTIEVRPREKAYKSLLWLRNHWLRL